MTENETNTTTNENESTNDNNESQETQETAQASASSENEALESPEITEETLSEQEDVIAQVSLNAHYIRQNNMLVIDLGSVELIPRETPEMPRARGSNIPRAPRERTPRKRPQQAAAPRQTQAALQQNHSKPSKSAGQQIRINAPEPGLVVRSDQTLMLKMNKDNTANILQTENWAYPPQSMTPESLGLKAKSTANFLSFQDPVQGFRFAYMVNHETKDIVRVVRKGKFRPQDVRQFMEKGYSEFLYSMHSSKFFRLPTGEIVQCKKQIDLDPETTVSEAKKQAKQGNPASVAALTGSLTGVMT